VKTTSPLRDLIEIKLKMLYRRASFETGLAALLRMSP
jgi:hypothetical protein